MAYTKCLTDFFLSWPLAKIAARGHAFFRFMAFSKHRMEALVEIEDMVAQFVTELARRGVDHLVARTAPGRYCAHCRNDDLNCFP